MQPSRGCGVGCLCTKHLKIDEVKTGDGLTIKQQRRPALDHRQLLITRPQLAMKALFTDFGPTLWMNHLFGATGSVWGYGTQIT